MAQIFVIDRTGGEHRLEAQPGRKVMEIIRDAGLPLEASCGGCCACATCHCYVDRAWLTALAPADEEEVDMLDMAFDVDAAQSRLTCRIAFSEALDGLRVTLAPN
ncbi:methylenetetrahydrofolate reductase [Salinisphaera orenii MK-B5]|uniref:Methylenetetrahydrofolate reductase n=2 Tax=Salinisphaera orenii TaxID=856731 RepID=A0A423PNG9_9GAMM|nr:MULTISPECIES: 2Fe-2S iron-sulfur cluster-binding protein [Salinisphaera]ROO25112.1 methylenetetrahydrofolate reductase [Salinisphaera halophila YIM 95161]ROO27129.1 methylenetetrahydrofolate reductase [Salinisphaera orenii MK-B5]